MDVILRSAAVADPPSDAAPAAALASSFYLLNISNKLGGSEYVHMLDDFTRMVAIQTTLQFMVFLSNPGERAFLSTDFVLMLIYILLGVALYWLVVRKIVLFR